MSATRPAAFESTPRRTTVGTFLRNSLSNAYNMVFNSLIALLLPSFLVHRLDPTTYSAWVLILNLGAYVGYLDFGVQTAISKYIAEHDAKGDLETCSKFASTGFAMMCGAMVLGLVLTGILAASGPVLFRNSPQSLHLDMQLGIAFVGGSLSLGLAGTIFPAIFLGLQRYQVPTTINMISRALYALVLCTSVLLHCNLAVMGAAVGVVNLSTTAMQYFAWRTRARHIRVRLLPVDTARLRQMVGYCFILAVWSVCMLFVSGVDLTIVGHYAFPQAVYYSIATAPTNFMLVAIGALMGPLIPAASALSTHRTPKEMGEILLRSTRYATIILLLVGLPLMVCGFPALRIWVGYPYAVQAVPLLRLLVLANIIRQLCAPYAMMVVATAQQRVATYSPVVEGVVNFVASIWLARSIGAAGVALGTLIGAFFSIGVHFFVSMHFTRNLDVPRLRLFVFGILRPMIAALPSLFMVRFWWRSTYPSMNVFEWILWGGSTLFLIGAVAIDGSERRSLVRTISLRLGIGTPRPSISA